MVEVEVDCLIKCTSSTPIDKTMGSLEQSFYSWSYSRIQRTCALDLSVCSCGEPQQPLRSFAVNDDGCCVVRKKVRFCRYRPYRPVRSDIELLSCK
jgi:hypothetical protein